MRMGIAAVIMLDLVIRSNSLIAFYTDDGLLPLSVLYKSNWNPSFFSVYVMSTGWKFISFLFVVNFVLAFLLLIGYRTRLMTILCWFFLISLHNRNPIILQGGDELLRLTLFWGIFLPWGSRYSLDSIRCFPETRSFSGISVLGYLLLLFSVYFFSALMKTSSEWRSEGTALYYALNLDQMTWPLAKWLLQFPALLRFLTHYTFYLELLAPFLLFIPYRTNFFRSVFFILIATLHLAIGMTLFVGLFFIIGIITLFALVPEKTMDKIELIAKKPRQVALSVFIRLNNALSSFYSIQISRTSSKLPELLQFQLGLLKRGFLFFVLCFNLLWCIGNTNISGLKVSGRFQWFAYLFRFDQDWGMFAPSVYKNDGWYIYEADLESKNNDTSTVKTIDLNRAGATVNFKKPENILALYEDDRWRKFGEIWPRQSDRVKKEFCRYLKNKWNRAHPEKRIGALRIVYMKEVTQPNYAFSLPERTIECDCEKW